MVKNWILYVDLGSFGVAPAILIYQYGMTDLGLLGKLIASIFTICGAMRLARFNVNVGEIKGLFSRHADSCGSLCFSNVCSFWLFLFHLFCCNSNFCNWLYYV